MCQTCQTHPVYEFTNKRKVCARCFIHYFQKKFFYINRKFNLIQRGDIIGYKNSGNFGDVALFDIINYFSVKSGIEIVDAKKTKKCTKLAISDTININSNKIINEIFKGDLSKTKNANPIEGNIIKPLYLFTDEEVLLYAKIRKLKFKHNDKDNKNKLNLFVNNLEKNHPELRRATISSWIKMDNLE